jgi:hypothetical protein
MRFVVTVIIFLVFSTLYPQEIIVTASKDNTIFSDGGDLSNGEGEYIYIGRTNNGDLRRALIYFDVVANLPENATIDSAFLWLRSSRVNGNQYSLHRLVSDWGEAASNSNNRGGGGGAQAESGDATWTHAFFNSSLWTTPGADFVATPSLSFALATGPRQAFRLSQAALTDLADMFAVPENNFGWIIIGNEESNKTTARVFARETGTADDRPALQVFYTVQTSIEDVAIQVESLRLLRNYPNPFNPTTSIQFDLANPALVTMRIFNSIGQEVLSLPPRRFAAGNNVFNVDLDIQPSGTYFYRIETENDFAVGKMQLLK